MGRPRGSAKGNPLAGVIRGDLKATIAAIRERTARVRRSPREVIEETRREALKRSEMRKRQATHEAIVGVTPHPIDGKVKGNFEGEHWEGTVEQKGALLQGFDRARQDGEDGTITVESQSEAYKAFRTAAQREKALTDASTDGAFYFVVCFLSSEQRDAFLKGAGWESLAEEDFDYYLDGLALAKRMGIPVPSCQLKFVEEQDKKRWSSLPAIRRVKR